MLDPVTGQPMTGPPAAWRTFLGLLHGALGFFGRISFLVDENTQAVHFFISALLQLLDRAGHLYGELARSVPGRDTRGACVPLEPTFGPSACRFILRLLGFRVKPKEGAPPGLLPGGGKPAAAQAFDAVWKGQ